MKTIASSALLLTLFVMVTNLHAAQPAHPLPPGIGRYILVLKVVDERPGTPKTITEPDVAKFGGKVLIKHENRRVIELPTAAAKALRNDSSVAYVQRVWMGEPLNGWDERDLPSGAAFKAQSDDVAGTGLSWSSGTYQYDPSSNIKAIGSDTYKYDTANRLVQAVVAGQTETYGYDSFGNLTQKTLAGQPSTVPAIDPSSNRIAAESYDAAGNVTTNGSRITYEFDSAGAMTDMTTKAGQRRRMIYTADDERIGTETDSSMIRWTFRDINSSKVLREFQDAYGSGEWEWTEDYIYAGGTLVGAETEQFWGGRRHFHLDHLGSVRMITSDVGTRYSRNDFYPFGAEQTSSVQEATNFGYWRSDPMKFTGHEREYYGMSNVDNSDYLDYMHARYYSPHMGRFLSVDPGRDWDTSDPQSWNMYSYVRGRPLTHTDPTGNWGWGDTQEWMQRAVKGIAAYVGVSQTQNAMVRTAYVKAASQLKTAPGMYSPEREALKTAAREKTTGANRVIAELMDSRKAGGMTARNTNASVNKVMEGLGRTGEALIVVAVAMSVSNVANAPDGQHYRVAAQEAGSWAGALAFGEAVSSFGAGVGAGLGAPEGGIGALPGAAIGGAVGAVVGAGVGAQVGAQVGTDLYDYNWSSLMP